MDTRFELVAIRETSRQRLNRFPDLRYYNVAYRVIEDLDLTCRHYVFIWAKDEADAARLFYRDFK